MTARRCGRRLPSRAVAALLPACMAGAGAEPASAPAAASAPAPSASSAPRSALPPAAAGSAPAVQLERVEIRATRASDDEQRRQSTAAKIVVGRDEIERYGDTRLGDVLKRLPGVSQQGTPGRGGEIRMRGLGGGYTQILLDGQRVPPGFSIDSLTPEQIERIEILRAPTAETGAQAIAGTINIVTREAFVRRTHDLRLTAGLENGRLQPHAAWTRNESVGPFVLNASLSAFDIDQDNERVTETVARRLDDSNLLLAQRETAVSRDRRRGVHATGRLQWRSADSADTVTLMPLLLHSVGRSDRTSALTQDAGATPPSYDLATGRGDDRITLARLNGQWNHRLEAGGRLEWKLGTGEARYVGSNRRVESVAGVPSRRLDDDSRLVDRNLLAGGKLVRTLANDHSISLGAEVEANRRDETRRTDDPALLANFRDEVSASYDRLAVYAQDEWSLSPQWAAHAGLRWEGITTRGETGENGSAPQRNRSGVWTPLLHAVWKPAPESRDQVRLSLTRSYRSPSLQSLIGRPSLNNRQPAPGVNTPTQPDRAGNPTLRPEIATGVDVAFERYFSQGGLLSANLFHREISDYLRSRTALEDVAWSPGQPRYVSRPQNVGDATTQGLELEAKFRLSDLVAEAPRVDLRAHASVFRSRVKSVPGPDNRVDQQPGYSANLGADYRLARWPVTVGGNLGWNPAYETRVSEEQRAYQGRSLTVDAYAAWDLSQRLRIRLSASNLLAGDVLTAGSIDGPDPVTGALSRETASTDTRSYLQVQLRLEYKL